MANVFGVQVVFGCNGEAGSRYHHGRNAAHVLDQCDSCSSCTDMNCPPVPLGLDDEKWLAVTSLKDADVDLASHLCFFPKQFDVVFDFKPRRWPFRPKTLQNSFFVLGRCHCTRSQSARLHRGPPRYAVIPVARKLWLPSLVAMPAAAAGPPIIAL